MLIISSLVLYAYGNAFRDDVLAATSPHLYFIGDYLINGTHKSQESVFEKEFFSRIILRVIGAL